MSSRDLWKRRLGPLWGGAVALASSSALVPPRADWRDDAPQAAWLVIVGAALGAGAYAAAALGRAVGLPLEVCATVAALVALAAGALLGERATAGLVRGPSEVAAALVAGTVLLRAQLVAALPYETWLPALAVSSAIGRWSAAFLQSLGDPILDPPTRSLVAAPPAAWELGAITAAIAVGAYLSLGGPPLVAMVLAAAAAFALGLYAQRQRGGLDAKVVGAVALAGELGALLALAAR